MVFRIASSPYTHNQRQTSRIMLLVLLAAVPGIAVQTWFFGWGTVLQIILAAITAWEPKRPSLNCANKIFPRSSPITPRC
jgi:electron transport complex protein RnfD